MIATGAGAVKTSDTPAMPGFATKLTHSATSMVRLTLGSPVILKVDLLGIGKG